ncbi:MAG: DUF1003 domain-containing protein [Methylobacteriaceae bacterium]|nr:DUF1003 domain-containing protein [Methylobacteriaceae bacterium]
MADQDRSSETLDPNSEPGGSSPAPGISRATPKAEERRDDVSPEDELTAEGELLAEADAEEAGPADGSDASPAVPRKRRKKLKALGACAVTGQVLPRRDLFPVALLRPTIADRLRAEYPDIPPDAMISRRMLDELRRRYIGDILTEERGQLTALEQEVVASLEHHETLAENIEHSFETRRSFGERLSDQIADFGGSWAFLISFFVILFGWMALNVGLGKSAFDEYPFILLNLVLSCLAAVQAPIIMMSQKRQEAKDRLRALSDYQVNLKAELEIRHLHEKIDHILKSQWERLAEMQEIQLDLLQELDRRAARRR